MPLWKQLRALMLPVTALFLGPAVALLAWGVFVPDLGAATTGQLAALAAGLVLAVLGLALMAWSIGLVARVGRGTLAPWDPAQRLVVRGPYRHVRNPMISGVLMVLVGECLVTRSPALVAWALLLGALNVAYISLREEHDLERRFGEAYRDYKRNVPAWLPQLMPWEPGDEG